MIIGSVKDGEKFMGTDIIINEEKNPKWLWWDLFLVMLILLSVLAFVAMFKSQIRDAVSTFATKPQQDAVLLFLSTFVQDGTIIAATFFIARRRGASIKDLGLVRKNVVSEIFFGIMGGLALSVLIWGVSILLALLFGPPPPQNIEEVLNNMSKSKNILLPFISVAILAPVSEEIYFRGMVYPLVKKKFGLILGIVLSGLFFGLMHLDLYRLIPISAGGALLAYFYEKTGTLISSITAHSMWNTVMLLAVYFASNHIK